MRITVRGFCHIFEMAVDLSVELRLNDKVTIRNCPPISARKRFKLEKVLYSPETERDMAHAVPVKEMVTSQ